MVLCSISTIQLVISTLFIFTTGKDPLPDKVDGKDINSVAGVLKLYFRELKDPLFPSHIFDDLITCSSQHNFNSQYTCVFCSPYCHLVCSRVGCKLFVFTGSRKS